MSSAGNPRKINLSDLTFNNRKQLGRSMSYGSGGIIEFDEKRETNNREYDELMKKIE